MALHRKVKRRDAVEVDGPATIVVESIGDSTVCLSIDAEPEVTIEHRQYKDEKHERKRQRNKKRY